MNMLISSRLKMLSPLLLIMMVNCTLSGCATAPEGEAEFALGAEDPELGKSLFEPTDDLEGKEDRLSGKKGLPISVDQSRTAVWEVNNYWMETDTPAARKAGMVWGENSGLTWDEKYACWIKSMEKFESDSYGETFTFTTPYGKTLPAPSLECAETSLFLRAAFASWYQLPFFIEAKDENGKRLYLGHFGFRTAAGKYGRSANFKSNYRDYSDLSESWRSEGWPQDQKLRGRGLGGSQDDDQPFLFEGARAGAYFDEIFLNKRTGYFMIYLLSYFGSVNLADSSNTFNIQPIATREGDTLLHRWQRRGIGHTLVVKHVDQPLEGFFEIELISGSMPRRQPRWENASSSKYSLTTEKAGGLSENDDNVSYARLGGGIKRWRIAQPIGGTWTNIVPTQDQSVFIPAHKYELIGERILQFEQLLVELTPELKREAIISRIIDARHHLSQYPASCAARIRREEAFAELYELELDEFDQQAEQVDARYRRFEDYVFASLHYEESKTCCWNKSTSAMYEIIMKYAEAEIAAQGEACVAPTVFKAYDGGYEIWAQYALEIGREAEWAAWSEDEECSQRNQTNDVIHSDWKSDYCMFAEASSEQ